MKLTDRQALDLFAEFREMPPSHRTERGASGCDLRAHWIHEMLQERDIENVEKVWIYSPNAPNGRPNYLIKPPVDTHYAERDEDYDEAGKYRHARKLDTRPFNIHVAPLITTVQDRSLVFDTYFYSGPPELDQWLEDFKPYEQGVELKHIISSPEYLRFEDIGSRLPREGSWSQLWQRSKTHALCMFELKGLGSNPLDTPLEARWIRTASLHPQPEETEKPEIPPPS